MKHYLAIMPQEFQWSRKMLLVSALTVFCIQMLAGSPAFQPQPGMKGHEITFGDTATEMRIKELDRQAKAAILRNDLKAHAKWSTLAGRLYQSNGNYSIALNRYLQAMDDYSVLKCDSGTAAISMNIGSVFQYMRDFGSAASYYRKSLALWQRIGSAPDIAMLYNNFGSLAEDMSHPDSALAYHRQSLSIWKQLDDTIWQAVSYSNMAACFDQLGLPDSSQAYLLRSLSMIDPGKSRQLYVRINDMLGLSYAASNRPELGLEACKRVQRMAGELHSRPMEMENCECLWKNYAAIGEDKQELFYFKRYIALKDSLYGEKQAAELTRVGLTYEFKKEQSADSLRQSAERAEIERAHTVSILREENRRNILLVSALLLLLAVAALWGRLRYMRRANAMVQEQHERADGLLHNILPVAVAAELMATGKAQAQEIPNATVLFTDFETFMSIVEHLPAAELVELVDLYFTAFDGIVLAHGLEKIKTIGDAYMACGGVPASHVGTPLDVVRCALELQEFVIDLHKKRNDAGLPCFAMRVGVHTGPIVAGVVGAHKFAFDIWGDTVNIAARMESSGVPGRVNISEATYLAVKDEPGLRFTPRGVISVKGKGGMAMYWVERM